MVNTVFNEMPRDLELKLRAKFGNTFHTYREMGRADKVAVCYWCDPEQPETHRALVNCWGTVHDVGSCEMHFKQYDGKLRDTL